MRCECVLIFFFEAQKEASSYEAKRKREIVWIWWWRKQKQFKSFVSAQASDGVRANERTSEREISFLIWIFFSVIQTMKRSSHTSNAARQREKRNTYSHTHAKRRKTKNKTKWINSSVLFVHFIFFFLFWAISISGHDESWNGMKREANETHEKKPWFFVSRWRPMLYMCFYGLCFRISHFAIRNSLSVRIYDFVLIFQYPYAAVYGLLCLA